MVRLGQQLFRRNAPRPSPEEAISDLQERQELYSGALMNEHTVTLVRACIELIETDARFWLYEHYVTLQVDCMKSCSL